jgi:acyl-CoA thioester hydrolase
MAQLTPYPVIIKEHHVDSLGHMNNATYLALYEEARWEQITERGFGFHEVQKLQQGPVIVEVNVKFMREIHLREKIHITTELLGYKGKIGQLKQQMVRVDGSIASEAVFTFGLFDLKARKLIDPTPEWNKAVGLV